MRGLRNLTLAATAVVLIVAKSTSLEAQAAPAPDQVPSIAVSITIENSHLAPGGKARVILRTKNVGPKMYVTNDSYWLYRVHVEGKYGEPLRTELQRHLNGDYRPGDAPDLPDTNVQIKLIAPGETEVDTYDLSRFYDLSAPDNYTVYMDIRDASGSAAPKRVLDTWIRTNTAHFTVEADHR